MYHIQQTINHQVHQQFTLFELRLQWLKWFIATHYKHVLKEMAVAAGLLVAIQLVYPVALARPRTFIGANNYGFRTHSYAVKKLNKLNEKQVKVDLSGKFLNTKLSNTGLQVNSEQTVAKAYDYKWYERLIPFSILTTKNYSEIKLSKVNPDQTKEFAKSLKTYNTNPADSVINIEKGQVVVKPAIIGTTYQEESVNKALENVTLNNDTTIIVPPEFKDPEVTTNEANEMAAALRTRFSTPLVINVDGDKLTVDPEKLASWIEVKKNDQGTLAVEYNRGKIAESIKSAGSKVYISQVANTITLVDGETVGATGGKKGQMLNLDQTIDAVIATSVANQTEVKAVITPVNPATKYIRSYTRSSKGINTLINDWVSSHGGQHGVMMISLDGAISGSANADSRFTSASIYKMYLADIVYNKVSRGELTLGDPINGTTIQGCIEVMIVRSDNPCAVALGSLVGWGANDGFLRGQGFNSTAFVSGGQLTTARDTANLLSKLMAGSLIAGDYKNQLLGYMNRNIYRAGIPAGSNGSVADKVGFMDGLFHDAAVVNHPKGTYILVIMSKGSSFGNIADLARKISNVMDQ